MFYLLNLSTALGTEDGIRRNLGSTEFTELSRTFIGIFHKEFSPDHISISPPPTKVKYFLKKKKTTQILKQPTFSHRNSHHNKKKCRISGTLSFSGGDGGSRTRVQTGISNAYYSLSGVVFRKEKDTSEIHPSYPLE